MTSDRDDELVPIHVMVPRSLKDAVNKVVPKGMLSHLIRNFLRMWLEKIKKNKGGIEDVIEDLKPKDGGSDAPS